MFGKNQVLGPVQSEDGVLAVQEIFHTIQGEGPFSGIPAVFVRLAGCNLRCFFCDTEFESNLENKMTPVDVLHAVERERDGAPTTLVVLTGGEPLRQNVVPLIRTLLDKGYRIQIETAGTLWVEDLEEELKWGGVTLVCSPKTPKVHEMVERYCRDWKYIISDRPDALDPNDGLPALSTQIEGKSARIFRPDLTAHDWAPNSVNTIWLQPCEEYELRTIKFFPKEELPISHKPSNDRNVELCTQLAMKYGYRLSLQVHKLVGLP